MVGKYILVLDTPFPDLLPNGFYEVSEYINDGGCVPHGFKFVNTPDPPGHRSMHWFVGNDFRVFNSLPIDCQGTIANPPNLSKAEIERLAILSEEAGEVQQIIGKILRHGYESYNPFDGKRTSNRELLQKEIGDLCWIADKMCLDGDIDLHKIEQAKEKKESKVKQYLHHQS